MHMEYGRIIAGQRGWWERRRHLGWRLHNIILFVVGQIVMAGEVKCRPA